jgi:HAD superfamily hydrolase (TIGR01549 family)
MKYNTFFFDFDGTIINSIEAIVLSMTETFASFGHQAPSEETIRHYIGIPLESIPYINILEEDGITRAQMIARYREIYETSYGRTHIHVYEGMKELLLDIKGQGAKLGIVSSKITEPIYMNLKDTDMEGIFDVIIGSDQVRQYKPFPETVFLCAHKIGLEDAARALVIGDAHHDIEMGHRAAMDTCAVPWGAGTQDALKSAQPTYFPQTMSQLTDILKS